MKKIFTSLWGTASQYGVKTKARNVLLGAMALFASTPIVTDTDEGTPEEQLRLGLHLR